MPETIGEAFVAIRPQTEGFEKDLSSSLGGVVKSVGTAIGGLFVASKATSFFKDAFAESQDALKTAQQTDAVIKSTGGSANVTAAQIDKLTGSLQKKAAIDDDVIRKGANMLLTFTNIRNEAGKGNDIFNQATRVLADVSVAMGTDIQGAAIQLGKALNNPVEGITALTRVGVTFTEEQKTQIQTLVQTGKTMDAQKIILQELTKEFGGSARAQATAADQAAVAFGNFKESIGAAITPLVTFVSEGAVKLIGSLGGIVDALGGIRTIGPAVILTVGLIGAAFNTALGPIGIALGITTILLEIFQKIGIIGGPAASSAGKFSDKIGELATRIATLDPNKALKTFEAFAKGGDSVQRGLGATARELGAFIRLADASPASAQKVIDGMRASGQATDIYERALSGAIDKQKNNKASTDALATANKNLLSTLDDLNDATLKQAGGELAYKQALIDVQEAQRDLDDAIKEHGPNSNEARDATLRLARAQLDVVKTTQDHEKATSDLVEQFRAVPGSIDKEIEKMREAQRTHPDIAASYNPIIERLLEIKRRVEEIPQEHAVKLTVDAIYTQAAQNLQEFLANPTPGGSVIFEGTLISAPATAVGGIFDTPQVRLLAEAGPEAVLPLNDPARANEILAQTGLTGSGGDTIVNNFYAPLPDATTVAMESARERRLAQWAMSV